MSRTKAKIWNSCVKLGSWTISPDESLVPKQPLPIPSLDSCGLEAKMRQATVEQLGAVIKQTETDPVILFGAGASAASGVPMAADMAALAARWATAMNKSREPEDPRIRESDVQNFLHSQPWYSPNMEVEDLYQHSMRLLNSPRELRRKFLLQVIHNVSEPSSGYHHLAQLARNRIIRTILTTNFDDCFRVAFGPGTLLETSGPEDHQKINTAPLYPQLIYLHGKADHYMDRIMEEEVQELDQDLVTQVFPLLRDHPLIVVGYRGAEPSIMRSLLIDQLSNARKFPHGIFWCALEGTAPGHLSPLTRELARNIGDNFTLVPIRGFDEFMAELSTAIAPRNHGLAAETGFITKSDEGRFTFDMKPARNKEISDVNQATLRWIVNEHSHRRGVEIPDSPAEDWYRSRLIDIGLFTRDDAGTIKPTNAAVLLCSEEGREITAGHWVEISTPERPPQAIDGPLTRVYETVLERLEEANRPIRIKGTQSRYEQPYGPIALKELLANALIHRDYETREPVKVWIDKTTIRIENPGGLDKELLEQLTPSGHGTNAPLIGEEFQNRIYRGEIGQRLTAYRNPILAEAFWGLGYVDKVGSGLVDAVRSLSDAGVTAKIEVPSTNDSFTATASLLHLEIDELTRTALPRRPTFYSASVTEILTIPDYAYSAVSKITRPREVASLTGSYTLPPFALRHGRLFTFSDLNAPGSPFSAIADLKRVQAHSADELSLDVSTQTIVPELLKKSLEYRFGQCGMRVDRQKNRAYYPCTRQDARSVSYTTMSGRPERRRVARWPQRLNVGHCEHDAVNYEITQFDGVWALVLQPTYVVTLDGKADQLPGVDHARVVTGLMSDHYNLKVLADVRFWLKQLETDDGVIRIGLENAQVEISTRLITFEGYSNEPEEQQG